MSSCIIVYYNKLLCTNEIYFFLFMSKINWKNITKLTKIFTILGVPCFAAFIGAVYVQQRDISESIIESKDAQIELLQAIRDEALESKNIQIEAKDAQIALFEKMQSDTQTKRLIHAKEVYEKDLAMLMTEIEKLVRKLDSVGVKVNKLKLAQEDYKEEIIQEKIKFKLLKDQHGKLVYKLDSIKKRDIKYQKRYTKSAFGKKSSSWIRRVEDKYKFDTTLGKRNNGSLVIGRKINVDELDPIMKIKQGSHQFEINYDSINYYNKDSPFGFFLNSVKSFDSLATFKDYELPRQSVLNSKDNTLSKDYKIIYIPIKVKDTLI